ncbi:ubiquitin-protein ligase E3C [Thrips palmi]|uniref:Ubiquitin-protein ligase E3C n=1 Tax=Thrips palmi TaxID=161013 RepID=A0A6P8Z7T0_THRPL|nr:ubiquitin-protein ligase E3C [Thrips palmi]XP_034246431.1 ubiquitin-protein ligase E3C [Thrips palmi]
MSYYNFDGEFRRMPQQSLGGASKVEDRGELIRRAHFERQKREEQRRKLNSVKVIQALVRSFLTRTSQKRSKRSEFDSLLSSCGNNVDWKTLCGLTSRLLFFYSPDVDESRLSSILEALLKQKAAVYGAALKAGDPWQWRLRRLLLLSLQYVCSARSKDANTFPLRVIEVFTSMDHVQQVLGAHGAVQHMSSTYSFLVEKGYMQYVRELLDSRTPPLLESSTHPPTPLVGCLLDMLVRPLHLVSQTTDHNTRVILLKGFCESILCPQLTEPIKLFVLPALSQLSSFPFVALTEALCYDLRTVVPFTSVLLYSFLTLDPSNLRQNEMMPKPFLQSYLQILASLTSKMSQVLPLAAKRKADDDSDHDSDCEIDNRRKGVNNEEIQVIEECVFLINNQTRVQTLLTSLEACAGDPLILQPLCQVCHNLLVSHRSATHRYRILNLLALRPSFLRAVWTAVLAVTQTSIFGEATPLLNVIARGVQTTPDDSVKIVPLLAVFCSLYTMLLITLHDAEFYSDQISALGVPPQIMPFTLDELIFISLRLKEVSLGLVELAFPESRPSVREDYRTAVTTLHDHPIVSPTAQDTQMWSHLFKVVVGLVQQLHARDLRRQFCPTDHWISKQIVIPMEKPKDFIIRRQRLRAYRPFQTIRVFTRDELVDGPPLTTKEVRVLTILRELPFLVAFQERVQVFQSLVYKDKVEHQGEDVQFLLGRIINLNVRRSHLYEDAFDKLSPENEPDLRLKMRVQLTNVAGAEEAGVDGGGLFREFLSELLKTAFDPNRGFFRTTNDNLLYPNPNVHLIVEDFTRHYYFIGRVLGKCLYENLLVELPLAEFFLSKLIGRNSDVGVHHLASLDPVMYKNLLFLKNYKEDVADLGLDFSVVNDELGETKVEELKPGGSNIPVTSVNRVEYIHLMADYKLNKQIRAQCNAFRQGLANVIPLEWIQMFNNKEVQVLVSGAEIPVDVEDLKNHTNYTGGYDTNHETIRLFWKVVHNFTDIQLRQLLKFVTSCSRPPLLGFKELNPPFCIQHGGGGDRLPTASTCMNLLKLPAFENENLLRERLLYALQSNAGFELS